ALAPSPRRLGAELLVLDLALELVEGAAHVAAHRRGGDELGDEPGDPGAGDAVGEAELDLRAPVAQLAKPPASPLIEPRHRRPCHIAGLVELHDLDQPADLGGADPEQDAVAGAEPERALVLGLQPRP